MWNERMVDSCPPCWVAGEDAADRADQRALHPEAAGLIEEVTHLRAHIAEARGRAEEVGVVVAEFVRLRDRRALVELQAGFLGDVVRHQFGNALDGDLRARHGAGAFGNRFGHLLDMAVGAVVEDENLRHRRIS
jgi:hypothetical protein